MLIFGTPDGIYRAPLEQFGYAEQVLDGRSVRQLRTGQSAVFAATASALLRSTDDGDTWTALGISADSTQAVHCTEESVYAGVQPAELYRSDDRGESWERQTSFSEFATDTAWPTHPSHDDACVRTIAAPTPDIVLVGVEVGGLVGSTDGGESWRKYNAVPDDVHHVFASTPERWIVSCGTGGPDRRGGVFETRDRGDTWIERDVGPYEYVRETCCQHGQLYAAGSRTGPLWDPPDAALFVEQDGELNRVGYPGNPESYIISWATSGQAIFAGTNDGSILRDHGDEWEHLGTVPVSLNAQRAWGVRSMTVIEP